MEKPRKFPERLCVGCNEMKPKRELVRVVKSPEDVISLDVTGKKPGRGAYVCRNTECFELAKKRRGFERTLKCKIDSDVYEVMRNELTKNG